MIIQSIDVVTLSGQNFHLSSIQDFDILDGGILKVTHSDGDERYVSLNSPAILFVMVHGKKLQ